MFDKPTGEPTVKASKILLLSARFAKYIRKSTLNSVIDVPSFYLLYQNQT